MRSAQLRFLLAILGACALGALVLTSYSSGQHPFIPGRPSTGSLSIELVTCQPSPIAEVETLFLYFSGGTSFYTSRYHLFGDGRLRREIVYQAGTAPPLRVDEIEISQFDLDLIFGTIVSGRLATMTPESLRVAMEGRDLARPIDGSTATLRFQFDDCESVEGEIGPLSSEVVMPSPRVQARKFPEVREVQAFLTVIDALDAYFPETYWEALHSLGSRGQE